jgi:hypothetical protein
MIDPAQTLIQRVTDTLYAPVRYTGSGSPEGVITSEPGWLYRDSSNGYLWAKVTGSGNTGWEVASFQAGSEGTCAIPTIVGSAGQTGFSHGLGALPSLVNVYLECVTTDLTYGVGATLPIESVIDFSGNPAFYTVPTTTAVYMRKSYNATNTNVYVPNATTGVFAAITVASWRFKISAAVF